MNEMAFACEINLKTRKFSIRNPLSKWGITRFFQKIFKKTTTLSDEELFGNWETCNVTNASIIDSFGNITYKNAIIQCRKNTISCKMEYRVQNPRNPKRFIKIDDVAVVNFGKIIPIENY